MRTTQLPLQFKGRHIIHRQDRASGRWLEPRVVENAITTGAGSGVDLFLDLISGLSSARLSQAEIAYQLVNGSGTVVFEKDGADSGPDHSVSKQVDWGFEDISSDTYTVDTIRVRQGSLTGTIVSETTGLASWDGGDNTTDVDKPSSENWFYTWRLLLDSPDAPMQDAGMDRLLRIISDNEDNVFGGPASGIAGNMAIRPQNDAGTNACSAPAKKTPDSGFPSRPNASTVRWETTVPQGECEDAAWDDVEMVSQGWTGTTDVILSDADETRGTKPSDEEWLHRYDLSA